MKKKRIIIRDCADDSLNGYSNVNWGWAVSMELVNPETDPYFPYQDLAWFPNRAAAVKHRKQIS